MRTRSRGSRCRRCTSPRTTTARCTAPAELCAPSPGPATTASRTSSRGRPRRPRRSWRRGARRRRWRSRAMRPSWVWISEPVAPIRSLLLVAFRITSRSTWLSRFSIPKLVFWEVFDPLPNDFSGSCSRLWMSGVVCANKLYMSLIHSWAIHVLDLSTRRWSPLVLQRPRGLIYHHIMAIKGTLIIAGLCDEAGGEKAVNIWKLDSLTQNLIQIGSMSGLVFDWLGMFCEPPTFTFLTDENVVYVSKAYIKDGARVAGEVSLEDCTTKWRVLPSVSSLGFRFDTMCSFCTSINISP